MKMNIHLAMLTEGLIIPYEIVDVPLWASPLRRVLQDETLSFQWRLGEVSVGYYPLTLAGCFTVTLNHHPSFEFAVGAPGRQEVWNEYQAHFHRLVKAGRICARHTRSLTCPATFWVAVIHYDPPGVLDMNYMAGQILIQDALLGCFFEAFLPSFLKPD